MTSLGALFVFPSLKLSFLAPLLIVIYYKTPLHIALIWSLACGILMDLLTGYRHIGIYAANYCLTTLILYPQKKHFFEDSVSTLPVITFFFAIISTLIQVVLLYFLETSFTITLKWVFTDLMIYPCIDALYTYFLFTLPGLVMPKKLKREYFL